MSTTEQVTTIDSEEQLLADLEASKTLPLWKQMARLNPPAPNPTTIPNVWRYKSIRPNLERAGNLVPESQAERRVLMLINPARGELILFEIVYRLISYQHQLTMKTRCTIYNRHPLRGFTTSHAKRDSPRTPTHGVCDALHHRRPGGLHGRARPPHSNATRRRDPHTDLELPRSWERRLGADGMAGWTGLAKFPALPRAFRTAF